MNDKKDLKGKTIVITGATSGMGYEAAKNLSLRGAYVIGIGRSKEKCDESKNSILSIYPNAIIEYLLADLSSQEQIFKLSKSIFTLLKQKDELHIDVLINNAGTFTSWYTSTNEGYELQFAVNYLSAFILTHKLMPYLRMSKSARIITISSGSHYHTKINWNDIQLRKHYNCLLAYKQTKLEDIMFTSELNKRLGNNSAIRAYSLDPGLVKTEIGFKGTNGIARYVWKMRQKHAISPAEGAATCIYLASDPSVTNIKEIYWKNCQPVQPSPYSYNEKETARLWNISEKMCSINSKDYGL